jgi:hypothetical protein
MYNREVTKYDMHHIKKYGEELNTTLILVRRSSSVPFRALICSW